MRAKFMLADAAHVSEGKLYVLGGGINRITQPMPLAVAGFVQVPWDETNVNHALKITLMTSEGQPFKIPTAVGEVPLELTANFQVGRPPGVAKGSEFSVPLAATIAPIPFPEGRYEFRLTLDDEPTNETLTFEVVKPH